ncbi:hypothetical protein [Halorubrum sp. CSM-61]|uniref:hypothetical protein n=1 Tax=Halorubrum sp. CSM-61 TaxID=2485838 RepID=UPI0013DE713D|nr:hypothetical protein [Halorubrum sp. CSM-61]
MTSIKQTLPSPKQPGLEELEGKTTLSQQEREKLLDELLGSEEKPEPASNSQAEPEAVIRTAQDR